MSNKKDNPKTDHEKNLHQNATDEKGPLKKEHYNQYGKKDDDEHEERGAKKKN